MNARTLSLFFVLPAAACSETRDDTQQYQPVIDPVAYAEAAAGESAAPLTEANPPPAQPLHNYDAKDGLVYSYVAAVSEEDQKKGRAAGDVVSFAYLGRKNGKHVLARVGAYDQIIGYASCNQPCRVITYSDGSKVGFNEGSIIGAAFADAIAGRLIEAEEVSSEPPPPKPSAQPVAPQQQPVTPPIEQNDGWRPGQDAPLWPPTPQPAPTTPSTPPHPGT